MSEGQKADANGLVRWHPLDREGCQYGVRMGDRVQKVEDTVDEVRREVKGFKRTMDRTFWALVTAAIAFGSAALMLGITIALR